MGPSREVGEAYFDHYEGHFRRGPSAREVFTREVSREHATRISIQILSYREIFSGCLAFTSLGLSQHPSAVGGFVEVIVVADDGFAAMPSLLAGALSFAIDTRITMQRGVSISGLATVDRGFVSRFGKSGLYFSSCHGLPTSFEYVHTKDGRHVGQMLMGLFVSDPELAFLRKHGFEEFESALEEAHVDPFILGRPSIPGIEPTN